MKPSHPLLKKIKDAERGEGFTATSVPHIRGDEQAGEQEWSSDREVIDEHTRSLKRLSDQLSEITKDKDALKESIKQLEADAKYDRLQSIQILAIFVAFFTFVSVQFQIFSNLEKYGGVIPLSLVLLGSVVLFASILIGGMRQWRIADYIIAISAGLLVLLGSALYMLADNQGSNGRAKGFCATLEKNMSSPKIPDEQLSRYTTVYTSVGCTKE